MISCAKMCVCVCVCVCVQTNDCMVGSDNAPQSLCVEGCPPNAAVFRDGAFGM
jgi:hypothetical protein